MVLNSASELIDNARRTFKPEIWAGLDTSSSQQRNLSAEVTIVHRNERTPYSRQRLGRKLALAAHTHESSRSSATSDPSRYIPSLTFVLDELEKAIAKEKNGARKFEIEKHDLSKQLQNRLVDLNLRPIAETFIAILSKEEAEPEDEVVFINRKGQKVAWDFSRVDNAVRKAFLATNTNPETNAAAYKVAKAVEDTVYASGRNRADLEDVQDMIEDQLMIQGHRKQAKAFIQYRFHQSQVRQARLERNKDSFPPLNMTRPNGTVVIWDGTDLEKRMEHAATGLNLPLSITQIETHLRRSLFDGISAKDLKSTILLNAKMLIEKDPEFAKFAGRLQQTYIYEEVLDWSAEVDEFSYLKQCQQEYFPNYIRHGIKIERLTPKLATYDLEKLAKALDITADLDLDYLGTETLYDRYLIVDKTGKTERRIETIQILFMRVAMGLFLNEPEGVREAKAIAHYQMMKDRRFCPSTPTLFNSGTLHSQLSSCYLTYIDDSLESIFGRGVADHAQLSKFAGGLGSSWTPVRGTGARIRTTNGQSQGVVPFLKVHNAQLCSTDQGGKRKGTGCAYLETWHNDLREFLLLRKNTGDDRRRTHDLNTAHWIPDLFMKRVEERIQMKKDKIDDLSKGGYWTFFRSNEVPFLHQTYGREFESAYIDYEKMAADGTIFGERVDALDLWKNMLEMLFETGHPWITFKDPSNIRSPQDHAGVIHSSNLCTEILLNTSKDETAVCNLASILIDQHLNSDGQINHKKLKATVRQAVEGLDNVIDINYYPIPSAELSNKRHRPIGLGVMGLQNALHIKGLAFESPEAMDFNDEILEAVAYYAYDASSDLAAAKGTYESYKGSKWSRGILPQDSLELLEKERGLPIQVKRGGQLPWQVLREKIKAQGMRNSNVLAIAPTATISNIMNTSACIEPDYQNLFVKSNLSGEFTIVNSFLIKRLKQLNLWSPTMLGKLKLNEGSIQNIEEIPQDVRDEFKTAMEIDPMKVIEAAARRQKWIDQSQSVNLWFAGTDQAKLSKIYRQAWHSGLKTTYYLRTLGSKTEAAELKTPQAKQVSPEALACSIEAARTGAICEVCQ